MSGWVIAAVTLITIAAIGIGFAFVIYVTTRQELARLRKGPTLSGSLWLGAQYGFLPSVGVVLLWGQYLKQTGAYGELRLFGMPWFYVAPDTVLYTNGSILFVVVSTCAVAAAWGYRYWRSRRA